MNDKKEPVYMDLKEDHSRKWKSKELIHVWAGGQAQ